MGCFRAYLFKEPRWGCKRLSTKCVENEFGDIIKKHNKFHATFLFSKATIKSLEIKDIIDGNYDEKNALIKIENLMDGSICFK